MDGGAPERLSPVALDALMPAISRDGRRVAFIDLIFDVNIWEVDLESGKAARPVAVSSQLDSGPQFSPDGSRISLRSNRSGADEVWVYDRKHGSVSRLTNMRGPLTGSARWSPDGSRIAFESRPLGKPQVSS